jgi:putative two-component system response regulator
MPGDVPLPGAARPRILVLDDEPAIRDLLARVLHRAGYDYVTTGDLAGARAALVEQSFDLLLCDITLPGESGLELVRELNRNIADVAVVMVTGEDDPSIAGIAISLGVYGYLVKPFTPNEILIQIDSALRRRALERVRRFHVEELESKVLERSTSLHAVIGRLEHADDEVGIAHREMADRLTAALSLRDEETGRHIERVGRYAVTLSLRAGLSGWPDDELLVAAMLHDIGKIAVPDLVLLKPGPLSPSELVVMRKHTEAGHRLLDGATARMLRLGASVAYTHHERWDGRGYPRGLSGADIPIEGRLVALADAFDAMTSDRVYRPALPVAEALAIVRAQRGRQFDPVLADVLLASVDELLAIRAELADEAVSETPVRVLLVDDHTMFAETAVRILDRVPGLSVTGLATSVSSALDRLDDVIPDVIVTEWRLPDGTGADLALRARSVVPDVAVVVLTDSWDDQLLLAALDAGCAGCIGKHRTFDDLTTAIRAAAAGDALMAPAHLVGLLRQLRPRPAPAPMGDLTDREREVLQLMAEGLSTDGIADLLHISVHTVRNHSQHVIAKLGAHSRLAAVAAGVRAGLVSR